MKHDDANVRVRIGASSLVELDRHRVRRGQSIFAMPLFDADDTLTQIKRAAAEKAGDKVAYRIDVIAGPESGASRTIEPQEPAVLVGQSVACAIRLTDREVSRRHLSLEHDHAADGGPALTAIDLGSTNGTRVNGVEIKEVKLCGGERVQLGATVLSIVREDLATAKHASASTSFGTTIGASAAMRRLYPLCEKLAAANVPLVIEGETGTGKEVLAESIHAMSPRAKGPFAVFDCTAVPANLMEAALFGHERGAFTGANDARQGVFEEAHRGTLLIDEIGDLDLELQAKLLRALERGEVRRIGGKSWTKVEVRVIAATRRDLDAAVQAGRFRDDLFYRIAVARIELPPLRKREGDITLLATHFWKKLADPGVHAPPDFLEQLGLYPWPGNVRELYNAVARRVALGELAGSVGLTPRGKPTESSSGDSIERVLSLDLPMPRAREKIVEEFELRYVERVLSQHGGNVTKAAAASGLALRYFQLVRARAKAKKA